MEHSFLTSNTTYILTQDNNLGGSTLHIPADCTIIYQGGKFSNGTIVFHHTFLSGYIVNENIVIGDGSTIANDHIATSWFFPDENIDSDSFNTLVDALCSGTTLHFDRDYILDTCASSDKFNNDGIKVASGVTYQGHGHEICYGSASNIFLAVSVDSTTLHHFIIKDFIIKRPTSDIEHIENNASSIHIRCASFGIIENCQFVRWKGKAAIHLHSYYDYSHSYGEKIDPLSNNDITIRNCSFIGKVKTGIVNGNDVFTPYNSGNALNVISGKNIFISHCQFYDVMREEELVIWPGAIDIETDEKCAFIDNIRVSDCYFKRCGRLAPISVAGMTDDQMQPDELYGMGGNVFIDNVVIDECTSAISIRHGKPCDRIIINNMKAHNVTKVMCLAHISTDVFIKNSSFYNDPDFEPVFPAEYKFDNVIEYVDGTVVISDNTFDHITTNEDLAGWGSVCMLINGKDVIIENNTFIHCYDYNGSTSTFALYTTNSSHTFVFDNLVYRNNLHRTEVGTISGLASSLSPSRGSFIRWENNAFIIN